MQIRRNHWLMAGAAAILMHAGVLIGIRSEHVGEASPALGPAIELAASLPGMIGSAVEAIEIDTPDKSMETGKPHKTAVKKTAEPEAQDRLPTSTDPASSELEAQDRQPTSTERKTDPSKTVRQQSRASRLGGGLSGSAGAKRGGGGSSVAKAGAINRYALKVRDRIVSRAPGASGRRGTTVIVFQLTPSGALRWARVRSASGDQTLDRKALRSVRRASPFPRPPSGARANQLRFALPFRFR